MGHYCAHVDDLFTGCFIQILSQSFRAEGGLMSSGGWYLVCPTCY